MIQTAANDGAEFVCLPEMFTTGSTSGQADKFAEAIPGPITQKLGEIAEAHSVYLVGGIPEKDAATGQLHNASVLISPQGELLRKYRKIFLYLNEGKGYAPGDLPCIHDLPGGRIALTICYDYVFPEYIRYLVVNGAQLLVHSTAWLTTDECEQWHYNRGAYRAMGMTRALENGVYFISANHWGDYDAEGNLRAIGQSSIISPWGEILDEVVEGEGVAIADVDFQKPEGWRANIAPYLSDYKAGMERLSFLNSNEL